MNSEDIAAGTLKYKDYALDFLFDYGPKLIGAIIFLILGLWLINMFTSTINRLMVNASIDESLRPFLRSLIRFLLKAMLVISIMGMVGIEMTSFIALLGAAGLAVGMALSGTLQNFAGGVMILIFKPFKVGDFIEAQGYAGTVKEIQVFVSILTTPDNKTIIIPNGGLSNGSMINYSTQVTRRVEWIVDVSYGEDIERVKNVLETLISDDERILKEPAPLVRVGSLADSSVKFTVRGWVDSPLFFDVFYTMNERIYITFRKEGIGIPFPQMDIHINNSN